jgi:CheY-like chemotaxis protein
MPQAEGARRVLLVEHDGLVAMLVEEMLDELGYTFAGNPGRVAEALAAVGAGDFDVAVLDVNLAGERVFPVADALINSGRPFAFATGYGAADIPDAYRGWPVAAKPFRLDDLDAALRAALTLSAGA